MGGRAVSAAEDRLRALLGELTGQVEPSGTLGDLFARIARRHRRRRLARPARSVPREPDTIPMTAAGTALPPGRPAAQGAAGRAPVIPAAPPVLHLCAGRCGRFVASGYRFCCWVCMGAGDGGWSLQPWAPGAHWTDVHTWTCEQRHLTRNPAAFIQAIAWHAHTRRPIMDPSQSHRCPARKCPQWVPNHLLMCGRHWRLVPRELQAAVYRAYDAGPEAAIDLIRAQSAAIAAVNERIAA